MNFKEGKRSTEWVKRLPEVVLALNSKETRLTGNKPVDAIREKVVDPNYTFEMQQIFPNTELRG